MPLYENEVKSTFFVSKRFLDSPIGLVVLCNLFSNVCLLGNNVKIINSYIWNDVVIEDESLVEHSIICNGCQIKR